MVFDIVKNIFFFFFYFTILYWFCHTSIWIRHRCTRGPHPEPPSHLPPCTIPVGHPSTPAPSILYPASNLDWWFISYMILYVFQCHSPKSFQPLPRVQKTVLYICVSFAVSHTGLSWFLQKLPYRNRTALWPAIPLLGIHTEETRIERDTCTPMFTAALFIIARTWKQPRHPSADEWIRKLWYIYTMEYYSAIKKNTFESVLMRWKKLEPIIQSEISQKEKHQYSILTHIYGI